MNHDHSNPCVIIRLPTDPRAPPPNAASGSPCVTSPPPAPTPIPATPAAVLYRGSYGGRGRWYLAPEHRD